MGNEIPQTIFPCDGCGEDLNVLAPFLSVQVKAQRDVLVIEEIDTDDPNEAPEPNLYLGSKAGRGRIMRMHNFACMKKYADARKDREAKVEYHTEKEIYVPEDNRTPEELLEAGEISKEAYRAIDRKPAEGGAE